MMGFLLHRIRCLFWTAFYRTVGRLAFAQVGSGAVFEGWVDVPQRGGRIFIGPRVRICQGVEFSVPVGGELHLGEGAFIGRGSVISAHQRVQIGEHTMLGEYVCIHDNDHLKEPRATPLPQRGFQIEPIVVGSNCWIGAGAVLVRGSGMGDHSILGAGAVLTKVSPAEVTAVGVPAHIIPASGLSRA